MKRIKTILCVLGSLVIISAFGQQQLAETSWDKLSELFSHIDQVGLTVEGEQGTDSINWMHINKVYHEGCELKIEYITDMKLNSSAICSVSILKIETDDLKRLDISGIPSLKLALSGKYIFFIDSKGRKTGKTNMLFFRACYEDSTYISLQSIIAAVKKSCNK